VNHEKPELAQTFKELGELYWPGPLTLVTPANLDKIPMMITANTGFIGIRIP
jgi:L-threonylcarbamoyladenylate synthase